MRSRSLVRSLAALLALSPAAALADPPAGSAPAASAHAPAPKAPPLPAPKAEVSARTAAPVASTARVEKGKRAANNKKKKAQDAKVSGPVATYPGFRMLDGGASRVFVSLSKKLSVTEHKAEGRLTYRIQGAQVPTSTNRLPLLTTFFATPVTRITLANREGDVDLVIDVKGDAKAQFRVVESDRGAELQVDFPKVEGGSEGEAKAPAADSSKGRPAAAKSLDSGSGQTAY